MQTVEKKAKTIQEAIRLALDDLGIKEEEAQIDILEEPSKGILGFFGSKPAVVKVSVKNTLLKRIESLMTNILKAMQVDAKINAVEEENCVKVNLEGSDLGILIGCRGDTLDALQYLVSLVVNRGQEVRKKIFLDVEGYRKKREETLKKLAIKLADKACQRGRNVVLEPMNSLERRIIHTALQNRNDVFTFSEGEEPYRKIIISPKKY